MTKAQVRKYVRDMKAAQAAAQKKLAAEEGKEQKEKLKEVAKLEEKLDDVFKKYPS